MTDWLKARWSPEEITNRLRLDYPDDPAMRVSRETIYQCLFVQGRGGLGRELTRCLRSGCTTRKAQGAAKGTRPLANMVSVSEGPAEADDRAFPTHAVHHLGPGRRDGPSPEPHLHNGNTRLLLRSALAMATQLKREHQRLPAKPQRPPTKDPGRLHAVRETSRDRCAVYLYPPFCSIQLWIWAADITPPRFETSTPSR